MTEAEVDAMVRQFQSLLKERGKAKGAVFDLTVGNLKLQERVNKLQAEFADQIKKIDYLAETNTKLAKELTAFKDSYAQLYKAFELAKTRAIKLAKIVIQIRKIVQIPPPPPESD